MGRRRRGRRGNKAKHEGDPPNAELIREAVDQWRLGQTLTPEHRGLVQEAHSSELLFSPALSAQARRFVHSVAEASHLFHESRGFGSARCVVVMRERPLALPRPQRGWTKPQNLAPRRLSAAQTSTIERLASCPPELVERALALAISAPRAVLGGAPAPPVLVEDVEGLARCAAALRAAAVVGVDVEMHSEFSYAGFVALVQLSSSDGDWLVDTCAPAVFESFGEVLGPVFSNADIIKVFHAGGGGDIPSLSRDFDVVCVNVFDTQEAARELAVGGLALADLLVRYCGVDPAAVADAKERYQCCDWRKRPLSEGQLAYAQMDSCHLPGLFLTLVRELLLPGVAEPYSPQECDAAVRAQLCEVFEGTGDVEGTPFSACNARSQRTSLRVWRGLKPLATARARARRRLPSRLYETKELVFEELFTWCHESARALDVSAEVLLPYRILETLVLRLSPHPRCTLEEVAALISPLPLPSTWDDAQLLLDGGVLVGVSLVAKLRGLPPWPKNSSRVRDANSRNGGQGHDSPAPVQLPEGEDAPLIVPRALSEDDAVVPARYGSAVSKDPHERDCLNGCLCFSR